MSMKYTLVPLLIMTTYGQPRVSVGDLGMLLGTEYLGILLGTWARVPIKGTVRQY